MIEVDGLVKRFRAPFRGEIVAVDHLSFRVHPGEIYGLLGPNGAGKSTTLRTLATLVQPDEGRVEVAGFDVRKDPLRVRSRLGWVPAESGVPHQLTPREVVRLFARIQGVDRPNLRADALLERLGAAPYADTPCGELSTGMKRRVVLARALVHDPQVLLLDEPTDGLDVKGRREVLDLVREQAAAGKTVIVSSHIMVEVERVVQRMGVVAHGKLRAEGSLADVLGAAGADNLDDAFLQLTGEAVDAADAIGTPS
jgi:sodium transport system ATP-binding protein